MHSSKHVSIMCSRLIGGPRKLSFAFYFFFPWIKAVAFVDHDGGGAGVSRIERIELWLFDHWGGLFFTWCFLLALLRYASTVGNSDVFFPGEKGERRKGGFFLPVVVFLERAQMVSCEIREADIMMSCNKKKTRSSCDPLAKVLQGFG